MALGDDHTDADMFAALPPEGLGVQVGPRPGGAHLRLADVSACRSFLEALI